MSLADIQQDFVDVPVKFLGQVEIPNALADKSGKDTATPSKAGEVIEHLLEQSSRKNYRNDIPKDLSITVSAAQDTLKAVSKAGRTFISIDFPTIQGLAVVGSKFAVVADTSDTVCTVYAFQVKKKAAYQAFLKALENGTLIKPYNPDISQIARNIRARVHSSSSNTAQPLKSSSSALLPVSDINHDESPSKSGNSRLHERILELEKQLAAEKANASAAEVARLSAVLRWVTAEKEAAEMKTEMAEMRAEMAGVAAEMAADMAQMKSDVADERTEVVLHELNSIKTALETMDSRMMRRASNTEDKHKRSLFKDTGSRKESQNTKHRPSSPLLRLVSQATRTSIDSEHMGMRELLKESQQKLAQDAQLPELSKEELVALVRDLRGQMTSQSLLSGKAQQYKEELKSVNERNAELEKELIKLKAARARDLELFEQEKNLLAATIAGQMPERIGAKSPLIMNKKDRLARLQHDSFSELEPKLELRSVEEPQPKPEGDEPKESQDNDTEEGVNPSPIPISKGKQSSSSLIPKPETNTEATPAEDEKTSPEHREEKEEEDETEPLKPEETTPANDPPKVTATTQQETNSQAQQEQQPPTIISDTPEDSQDNMQTKRVTMDTLVGQKPAEPLGIEDQLRLDEDEFPVYLEISKGDTGLGFRIAGGRDDPVEEDNFCLYITQVIEGGAAHTDGRLQVGDKLLSVGKTILEGMAHADAVETLVQTPAVVQMYVARLPREHIVEDINTIELVKGEGGLGFSIAGGTDVPVEEGDDYIYITSIIEGETAALDGRLRVGDKLLEVNDVKMENLTHAEAVKVLQNTGATVTLVVASLPEEMMAALDPLANGMQSQVVEDVVTIEFDKGPMGLCMNIAGGCDRNVQPGDSSIYVTQVIEGGAAFADGRLLVGDRLLEVNGTSVMNVTHQTAIDLLQSDPDHVRMVVSRLPPPVEVSVDITLNKGPDGFGFTIAGGIDEPAEDQDVGVYITHLIPGNVAHTDGQLQLEDKILFINNQSVEGLTHEQVVSLLSKSDDLKLTVSRLVHQSDPAILQTFEIFVEVFIEKGENGLGFSIAGGRDECVQENDPSLYITNILPGTSADQQGALKLLDRIVEVNDVDVTNVTHKEAVELLQLKPNGVKLRVARLPGEQTEDGEVVDHIEFARSPEGLGFSIAGGLDQQVEENNPSLYVTGIVEGSNCAADGRLQIGDKLLFVNGQSLENVTHEFAVQCLTSNPTGVKLTVSRIPPEQALLKAQQQQANQTENTATPVDL
eukprot:m.73080 g.73080  ORF g.73080 m.73080 type:complete len:1258 (+) comp20312_c0_seq1:14-3787(+)